MMGSNGQGLAAAAVTVPGDRMAETEMPQADERLIAVAAPCAGTPNAKAVPKVRLSFATACLGT